MSAKNSVRSKEELRELEDKINKNIRHLIAAINDVGERKFYIISKDCDGCEHVDASFRIRDEIALAIENLRTLSEGLANASICAEARKDCMIHYFKKWKGTKDIALKYPDLPVKDVLDMVVTQSIKEKQDAEQG